MTGNTRESVRPSMRKRPSDGVLLGSPSSTVVQPSDASKSKAAPVLFRLPSIAMPGMAIGAEANVSHGGMASAVSGPNVFSETRTAIANDSPPSPIAAAVTAAAHFENAEKKAAGQRLLNTLIIILLLASLVVISALVFQPYKAPTEVAKQNDVASDPLAALNELHLPAMASVVETPKEAETRATKADSMTSQSKTSQSKSSQDEPVISLNANANSTANAEEVPAPLQNLSIESSAPESGLDLSAPAAQVQLGRPVPFLEAVNSEPDDKKQRALQVSTPRYETVSALSPGQSKATGKSEDTLPKGASLGGLGASPSLWDGAKRNNEPESEHKAARSMEGLSSNEPPPKATPLNQSLGVTVGGGLTEPGNLIAGSTSTPDMDVADISKKYVEYAQAKKAAQPTTIINPYATTGGNAGNTNVPPSPQVGTGYTGNATGLVVPSLHPSRYPPTNLSTNLQATGMNQSSQAPNANYQPGNIQTGYGQPNGQPVYNQPIYNQPGYYQPGFNQPGNQPVPNQPPATQPVHAQPGISQPNYYQPGNNHSGYIPPNYGQSSQTGVSGYSIPSRTQAVQTNAYPASNYSNGMIGQSGFATAPSGDVMAPPIPVMGKVGVANTSPRGP